MRLIVCVCVCEKGSSCRHVRGHCRRPCNSHAQVCIYTFRRSVWQVEEEDEMACSRESGSLGSDSTAGEEDEGSWPGPIKKV